jgi:hypothetical protein
MLRSALPILLVIALLPRVTAADRGALTLEVGPALTLLPSAPSDGTGGSVNGTVGGVLLGGRYAVRNSLELTGAAFYEAAATFFHPGVHLASGAGSFDGTLSERTTRYGALVGARVVRGIVLQYHFGAEVGWAHQVFRSRDLVNVSDPANPHSFGLGLKDASHDALVLAPLAGVEWQVADHWTVAVTPRAELMLGGAGSFAFMVPVTMGYSWFVF